MTQADQQEPLLRVEFGRDALRTSDRPLDFVIHELGAICERIPHDLLLSVNVANKIKVVITLE